jgi:hypothetical protein
MNVVGTKSDFIYPLNKEGFIFPIILTRQEIAITAMLISTSELLRMFFVASMMTARSRVTSPPTFNGTRNSKAPITDGIMNFK